MDFGFRTTTDVSVSDLFAYAVRRSSSHLNSLANTEFSVGMRSNSFIISWKKPCGSVSWSMVFSSESSALSSVSISDWNLICSTAADTAVRKYDAFFAPAYNDFVRVCIRSSINTSFDTYLPFRRLLGLIILPGHCPAGVRSQETDNSPLLQYLPIAWAPYGPSRLSLMKMAFY